MTRDVSAQSVIVVPLAVFLQGLSFSFLLLRNDRLMTVCYMSTWSLFVVLLDRWPTSLSTLSQPLAGNPLQHTAACRGCTSERGQAGCWFGGKRAPAAAVCQEGRSRPLKTLIDWVAPSSCYGDIGSRGRSRGGGSCSSGPDGVVFGGKVTDSVTSGGPVTLYDEGRLRTASKNACIEYWVPALCHMMPCVTLSLIFKVTTR